jgi:hypothetical protein
LIGEYPCALVSVVEARRPCVDVDGFEDCAAVAAEVHAIETRVLAAMLVEATVTHPHQITFARATAASACWEPQRLQDFVGRWGISPLALVGRMQRCEISPADTLWALCCASGARRLHLECVLEYHAGLLHGRGERGLGRRAIEDVCDSRVGGHTYDVIMLRACIIEDLTDCCAHLATLLDCDEGEVMA